MRRSIGLVAVAAVVGCNPAVRPGDRLVGPNGWITKGLHDVAAGERVLFGMWVGDVRGNGPVHLLEADVLGAPDSLVIDDVWGIHFLALRPYPWVS